MRMVERNYSEKNCGICGDRFKPNHPRLLRCRKCHKEKCSGCGRAITAGFSRMKTRARKCSKCYPLPVGSVRNHWAGYKTVKTKSGWQLEHRAVAEKMIGRRLRHSEVVHHVDGRPSNNAPENLVVCKSNRDHLDRFHKDDLKNPPLHHNGRRKKGSPGWKPIKKSA